MLEKIFILSFMVMAIWSTMWEGMIFGFIRKWGEAKLPEKLQMPIFECPICMFPYYGSLLYYLIWEWNTKEWALLMIAGMGVNAVFIKLFPKDEVDFNLKNN